MMRHLATEILDICGISLPRITYTKHGIEYVVRCHKNEDKEPSCSINEKGYWHCFSCGGHGDAVEFVMERLDLNRSSAMDLLRTPDTSVDEVLKLLKPTKEWKKKTYHCLQEYRIPKFYKEMNYKDEYLRARGISRKVTEKFKLMYSDIGRFGQRIIIPLYYEQECVGVTARAINNGESPKYLHSTNAPVSKILFGYDQCKLGKFGEIILVEGPFDVLKLHSAGIPSGVAVLGSNVSERQLELLNRLVKSGGFVLAGFDCDRAGFKCYKKLRDEHNDEFDIKRWLFWKANQSAKDIGDLSIREVKKVYQKKYFLDSDEAGLNKLLEILE